MRTRILGKELVVSDITIGLLLTALLLYTSCKANKTETHEIRFACSTAPTGAKETNVSKEESYKYMKTSNPSSGKNTCNKGG